MNNILWNQNNNLMNYNLNMNMMNNFNMNMMNNIITNNMMNIQNMNNMMQNNQAEVVYPYIKENTIVIILLGNNNRSKSIQIPTSLRLNELYYTVYKYDKLFEFNHYSPVKLFHKNSLLSNDDSPINFISNGDIIKIQSDIDYNNSYFRALLEIHKSAPLINISFKGGSGFYLSRSFPNDITFKEMFEAFFNILKIPNYERTLYMFLYDGKRLNENNNNLLKTTFRNMGAVSIITFDICQNLTNNSPGPGKIFLIYLKNFREDQSSIEVGTLEQINIFYERLKNYLYGYEFKMNNNPILYPGEIELKKDDERTFSSIGIRDNCIVYIK